MAGDPPSPLPASSASRAAEGLIYAGATGPAWGVFSPGPSGYAYLNARSISGILNKKAYRDKGVEQVVACSGERSRKTPRPHSLGRCQEEVKCFARKRPWEARKLSGAV